MTGEDVLLLKALAAQPWAEEALPTESVLSALVLGRDRFAFAHVSREGLDAKESAVSLTESDAFVDSLRKILRESKAAPRACRLVIASGLCEARTLSVPPGTSADRTRYLARALREEPNTLWKAVPLGTEEAPEWLAAKARPADLRPVLRRIRRAGLRPRTCEPSFAPCLGFLAKHPAAANGPVVAVDFTLPEEVCVSIWDEGALHVCRRLPAAALGEDRVEFLAPEVLRTAAFYRSRTRGRRARRVLCMGLDRRFDRALSALEAAEHFEDGILPIGPLRPDGEDAASLLALARIAAISAPWEALDLLPASERHRGRAWVARLGMAGCALAAGAAVGLGGKELRRLQTERARVLFEAEALLSTFAETEAGLERAASERERIERLERRVGRAARARADLAGALADVLEALPAGVTLEAILFDAEDASRPPRLVLHGVTSTSSGGESPLETFLAAVQRGRSIERASCEAGGRTGPGGATEAFTMRLQVARTDAG